MKISNLIYLILLLSLNMNQIVFGFVNRTTADRIRSFGYTSETHTVTTKDGYILNVLNEDGYILNVFRIAPTSKGLENVTENTNNTRPVVLMMHGLLSSSDGWIINGPADALAFNLVDSGYDVWLGNGRGTPYGDHHTTFHTNEKRFWRFSWHEIGVIDLPTTIDYILKTTQQSALHYVGHSQGTAIMFVLLSTRPRYNKKLKSSHMLAPIAYMKNVRSPLIRSLTPLLGSYTPLDPMFGDMPFLQQQMLLHSILGVDKCRSSTANADYCSRLLYTIAGGSSNYIKKSLLPEIFNTHPASCSTHQAIHLIQLHRSGRFCAYDYGLQGNGQRYHRSSPPDYKLANINPRFPMHLYYSDYDELSSKIDVEHLSRNLGNRSISHFIDLEHFAHLDFLWASNVKEVINYGVIARMGHVEYEMQRNGAIIL